jgi:hypothetical protein
VPKNEPLRAGKEKQNVTVPLIILGIDVYLCADLPPDQERWGNLPIVGKNLPPFPPESPGLYAGDEWRAGSWDSMYSLIADKGAPPQLEAK